jgi:hypothetical protein
MQSQFHFPSASTSSSSDVDDDDDFIDSSFPSANIVDSASHGTAIIVSAAQSSDPPPSLT